jgi:glycosyltransferase involved in cell wall biosynthesis
MQIVQTVFGVFHHFELARELERRGHLRRVYSTWPWARLKREGLAHQKVETFPWLHLPEYLASRAPVDLTWLRDPLGYANAVAFDRWTESQLRRSLRREGPIHALIGISGSSLRAGALIQRAGGIFLCDRGSTHQRYQEQLLADEFRRWGVEAPPSDPRDTRREEAIYAACNAITVPSTVAARSFAEMGVPAGKVHVIPYGVRLENFRPTAEPPGGPDAEFAVLFAGSVGLRKGVPYLLEAFARLPYPRKCLRIVGSVQEDIRAVLPKLPMHNVELLGSIPQAELAGLMSRSHVLVLPSIEEGLALVQAQAMACGCPVICSTNTGGEDLFTDGVEGYIVPIRDPAALSDRLQRLADDPDLQRSMREAALRRVRSIGGWAEYGDRWERLLRELTQSTT